MNSATALGVLTLAIWLYLLVGRGGFWLTRERDDREAPPQPSCWPSVVAVVPARNEADVIGHSVKSLLQQDYPGPFRVVLVDDDSDDGGLRRHFVMRQHPKVRQHTRKQSPEMWSQARRTQEHGLCQCLLQRRPKTYEVRVDVPAGLRLRGASDGRSTIVDLTQRSHADLVLQLQSS